MKESATIQTEIRKVMFDRLKGKLAKMAKVQLKNDNFYDSKIMQVASRL